MTQKANFERLLKIGYTVDEALSMIEPEAVPADPTPEPTPDPKPEPEPEPKPEPQPVEDPSAKVLESLTASNANIMKALETLTKAVQASNRLNLGTDEDPGSKKADEFLKVLLEGKK